MHVFYHVRALSIFCDKALQGVKLSIALQCGTLSNEMLGEVITKSGDSHLSQTFVPLSI